MSARSRGSRRACSPRTIAGAGTLGPESIGDVASGRLRPGEPLGVYVHFPFCGVRCPYCDFAVDTRADIPHDAYADAVVAEIAARRGWYEGAGPLVSIYSGAERLGCGGRTRSRV